MRTLVLASARRHARRYVATAVAIVIAVGFMIAVNAVSAAARTGAEQLAARQLQGVDLVVDYPGTPDRVIAAMEADPDVERPEVVKSGYVPVGSSSGPSAVAVDTVDSDPSRVWQTVESGRLPKAPDEVVVDAGRLDELGLEVGSTVRLGEGATQQDLTVVGTVDSTGGPRSGALYVTSRTADLLGDAMYPSFVLASVRDGVSPDEVAARLNRTIGEGDTVTSASALAEEWRLNATNGIDVFQQLLLGFAAVALFVGALVIANTFAIVLAQRERDVALLRCVGATRRQVVRSVTIEAFLVGLVSAVLGVAAGWLAAFGLVAAAGRWLPTAVMADPTLSAPAVVLPVVVAVLVTVVASWAPARRVARIAPVAALQPHQQATATSRTGIVRTALGVLLLGLGVLALVASLAGDVLVGLAGGFVSFVGVLLLLPLIVPVSLRTFGAVVARGGVASRLAVANTGRNPRRTATTTSALLVGVTLVATVLVGIATARQAVATELDETKPVDVMVMAPSLPASTVGDLRKVDGVRTAVGLDGADGSVGDVAITVLGVGDAAADTVRSASPVPPADEVWVPWRDDLLSQAEDGQTVRVSIGDRSRELTVRYVDGFGPSALVSSATLDALTSTSTPQAVWVRAKDGANPASVIDAVLTVTGDQVEVDGGLPDRAEALKQVDILLAIVLSLLGVAVVIAVVGVGNTLGLSVLERSRENSLLRALGLPARGLRATLAIESVLMATTSAVLGGALGVLYGWFGVKALGAKVFVTDPQVVVPIGQLSTLLVAAVLAGLLASVVPARRAARIKPAAGLAAV